MADYIQGYLYLITNRVNGKRYVGITLRTVEYRWAHHQSESRRGGRRLLCCALRKYSADVFDVASLKTIRGKDRKALWARLCKLEIATIAALGTKRPLGYNSTDGGDGIVGHEYTEEQRAAMSAAKTKMWSDPSSVVNTTEYRAKRNASMKLTCSTTEQRARLSAQSKNSWADPERRTAREAAMIAAHNAPEVQAKHRAAMTRRLSDPEYYQRLTSQSQKNWADPNFRKAHKAALYSAKAREKRAATMAARRATWWYAPATDDSDTGSENSQ